MLRGQQLLVLALLLSGLISRAAVTPVRFYRLGEGDAGVGHAIIATNSIDSVSTNALGFTGAPKYWGHAARGNTNSTFSILFSTADQASVAVESETDNVCLEAWANSGWRTSHVVVYNGISASNGYGFILDHTNYLAVLGGVGTVATIPCPPGEWMHLALVCSNGTVAIFTNGTLAAVTNATPNPPTGNLNIGGPNASDSQVTVDDIRAMDIKGFVDDVRISTFGSGAFNVTDLLYAPSPQTQLSVARNGTNIVILVPANRTLARLQATTNLISPNWQNVDLPETLATHTTWIDSLQGTAKFYRLNPASLIVPVVMQPGPDGPDVPIPFGVSHSLGGGYGFWDPNCNNVPIGEVVRSYEIDGTAINAADPHTFDASPCVDPLTETSNTLSFHWQIRASPFYGGNYYNNLPDYSSAMLQIPSESLPDLPDTGSPNQQYWMTEFLIRHIPYTPGIPSQQAFCAFHFIYTDSGPVLAGNPFMSQCPAP